MSWDNWNRVVAIAIYDTTTGIIKRVTSCDAFHTFQQMNDGEWFVELTERLDMSAWVVVEGVLTPVS